MQWCKPITSLFLKLLKLMNIAIKAHKLILLLFPQKRIIFVFTILVLSHLYVCSNCIHATSIILKLLIIFCNHTVYAFKGTQAWDFLSGFCHDTNPSKLRGLLPLSFDINITIDKDIKSLESSPVVWVNAWGGFFELDCGEKTSWQPQVYSSVLEL